MAGRLAASLVEDAAEERGELLHTLLLGKRLRRPLEAHQPRCLDRRPGAQRREKPSIAFLRGLFRRPTFIRYSRMPCALIAAATGPGAAEDMLRILKIHGETCRRP